MTSSAAGEGMLRELRWVHDMLRRDLEVCRLLAAALSSGVSAPEARLVIDELQTKGLLWQLRTRCLGYCTFVHGHHGLEDAVVFPAVRAADPAGMTEVTARLEADHRVVSSLLDEVEAAGLGLDVDGDDTEPRARLADSLEVLAEHLLAHLAFEEEALAPVLRTWTRWPGLG